MGDFPMPKQDDYEQNARGHAPHLSMRAENAYPLALAERWLRPADQLDYVIRRWVIPVPLEISRSAAPIAFAACSSTSGAVEPHKAASIRSNAPLTEVQAAIGQHLRAEYVLERSVPAQLANLLKQFEQREAMIRA